MAVECASGKRCFDSVTLAKESLIHILARYSAGEGPQGIYQCDLCGCYHLTSDPGAAYGLDDNDRERIAREREARHWEDKFRKK